MWQMFDKHLKVYDAMKMQCDSGWKGVGARKKCQQKKQYDLRRKDSCEMHTKEQLLKEILSKGREQGKEESREG